MLARKCHDQSTPCVIVLPAGSAVLLSSLRFVCAHVLIMFLLLQATSMEGVESSLQTDYTLRVKKESNYGFITFPATYHASFYLFKLPFSLGVTVAGREK